MLSEQTSPNPDTGYITLPSRFDFTSSAAYRIPFARLLSDPDKSRLVINCSGMSYVDSCGVGTLIAWHRACGELGKKLLMQNCGDRVMEIFRVLAVDRLFSIL